MISTRDQKMAADIYNRVQAVAESKDEQLKQEYRTMTMKLPALIRTAGLVQALAFVEGRDSKNVQHVLDDLAQTLAFDDRDALLKQSREAGLPQYMYLTTQVLDALLWYRRAVQMHLGKRNSGSEGEAGNE